MSAHDLKAQQAKALHMKAQHITDGLTRRGLLLSSTALASAVVLAACGTGDAPAQTGAAGAGYVSGDGTAVEWGPAERDAVVELSGQTMEGDAVDIADWRGAPVVLNFWYATCPPCRKEAPDLVALAEEFSEEGVRFLGVNHTDEPDTAIAFQRTFKIPYPSLYDADASGAAALQGVVPLQAMPSTVVLDAQGRVAARIIGLAEPSTLKAMLVTVLAES